jgi:predicted transcriptional regulator/transcriptional regulator with XRE-family HTH domain
VARKPKLGPKIRRLRNETGLTQVQLAQRLMISASYLNLIEHNQRPVTVSLLSKLGEVLNIDLQTLSKDEDTLIRNELSEILTDPLFSRGRSGVSLKPADLNELISLSPSASQAIVNVYRAYRQSRDDILTLGENLSEDTLYVASSNELRTVLSSISSFFEILRDNEGIFPEEHHKFLEIIAKESNDLSKQIKSLMSFVSVEDASRQVSKRSPLDEINDFIQSQSNYFPGIENAAEKLVLDAKFGSYNRLEKLIQFASNELGVTITIGRDQERFGLVIFNKTKRSLYLSSSLPRSSLIFKTAQLIGRFYCEEIIEDLIRVAPLTSEASREMCRDTLARYFAGAVFLPYDEFIESARTVRYDIEQLQNQFAASFEQICHRLATLNKVGLEGVPFHFIRVDIAGNISKRFDGSGIRIPLHGGVCPRWNVHHAFLTPESMNVQTLRMVDGSTFLSLARATVKSGSGYNTPKSHYAVAVGCEIASASELIYADGLNLNDTSLVVPAGTSCRICERDNCGQRAFQSMLHSSMAIPRLKPQKKPMHPPLF